MIMKVSYEYFEVGKEIITFKDEKDFLEKAHYYLTHDMERQEIALNARTRVLKDHSYSNRLRELLSRVFGIGIMKSLGAQDFKREEREVENNNANMIDIEETTSFPKEQALNELSRELLREQEIITK